MKFTTLGLMITKKCNAKCNICCFSCSPSVDQRMPLSNALDYLQQASKIKSISSVGISGGEPFLYYEDLLEIIKSAKSIGFKVSCTTNGFWGKSYDESGKIIDELIASGLNHLSISVDEFHSKFVPYENIKNILKAAKDRSFPIMLGCITTKNSDRLSNIAEVLGDDLLGFLVMESPCLPVGRAKLKISEKEFIDTFTLLEQKCYNLNTLGIMPDGSAYPCCSQTCEIPALYLGSANEQSLNEIVRNFNGNMYCRLMEKYGPQWFINTIKENKLPIPLKNNYVNICDICYTLFNNDKYLEYYQKYINVEAKKIIADYQRLRI